LRFQTHNLCRYSEAREEALEKKRVEQERWLADYNRDKERKAAERQVAIARFQAEREAAALRAAAQRAELARAAAVSAAVAANAAAVGGVGVAGGVAAGAASPPAAAAGDGGGGAAVPAGFISLDFLTGGADGDSSDADDDKPILARRGASNPVPIPSAADFMPLLEAFHLNDPSCAGKTLKVPVFCHKELDLHHGGAPVQVKFSLPIA
jgi:hypothetical protein